MSRPLESSIDVTAGDPYLTDPELPDLYAFLLEANQARRGVGRGDDLHELIMRPIDTDELEAEIRTLEVEKRDLDERLERLERLETELSALEDRRAGIESKIEAVTAERESIEAELEDLDTDVEESRTRKDELESVVSDLRGARQELESIEYDLETERESRDELEREHERLTDELDELGTGASESPERLEGRIRELRERKRSLDTILSELQSVSRFNEDRLEDGTFDLQNSLEGHPESDGSVTDLLLDDGGRTVCWTCGSEVERDAIESTLEQLRALHQNKLTERNELQAQIDDLGSEQKELRERRQRLDRLETRLETIDDEIGAHHERIDELEATVDERDDLEARREDLTDELADLRTRVDRIEADAVEAFNDHMVSICTILEYANVDRIWIERRERTVRERRRNVQRATFELHVVRSTADGATYEDTVEHLSESEREVTGLVVALAGYLVHDVHELVPFMLLDSLEAIDSDRIADLIEYFEDYVDCLVVALLPEDASALAETYHYTTRI